MCATQWWHVLWKLKLCVKEWVEKVEKVEVTVNVFMLSAFKSVCCQVWCCRLTGCDGSGPPQTRCRLGALLNNHAPFLLLHRLGGVSITSVLAPLHNPNVALPIHQIPLFSPHPLVPRQYCRQYKLWWDFSRKIVYFLSVLCFAAYCLSSLLFSKEINQLSPEVDLVHSEISACQDVLWLLHSLVAEFLSPSLPLYLPIWPVQVHHQNNYSKAMCSSMSSEMNFGPTLRTSEKPAELILSPSHFHVCCTQFVSATCYCAEDYKSMGLHLIAICILSVVL